MRSCGFCAATVVLICLVPADVARAQGTYLSTGGPVNQAMGGASTAAPLDAIGATYWNPATISDLRSELAVGLGLLLVTDLETSSSVPGLGSGSTAAEPGTTALPTVGWVHHLEQSPITIGLGIHAVAGFKTNYPSSATNPFFAPQSNAPGVPGGFGRIMTQASFLQLAPMLSFALSDKLSVGLGPTLTLGELTIDPLVFAAPDDADGSLAPRYPSGCGTRSHWGGGAQLGVYYITDPCWRFGMSIKSPQWMEDFRYHTENELGLPRVVKVKLDLPMIISFGTSYSGYENLILAVDVRYFDYKNTDFWGPHGFNADGSLAGLGMSSVASVATGAQLRLSDSLYMRLGYTFNQSPFQSAEVTNAVAAPLYYQHQIHIGASQRLSDAVAINIAYSHSPKAKLSGPLVNPAGTVGGSNVTTTEAVHYLNLGVSVKY